MTVRYTRMKASNEYEVWRDASHRIGVVRKRGFWWFAITPGDRVLDHFASMSEAGERLVREEEKNADH